MFSVLVSATTPTTPFFSLGLVCDSCRTTNNAAVFLSRCKVIPFVVSAIHAVFDCTDTRTDACSLLCTSNCYIGLCLAALLWMGGVSTLLALPMAAHPQSKGCVVTTGHHLHRHERTGWRTLSEESATTCTDSQCPSLRPPLKIIFSPGFVCNSHQKTEKKPVTGFFFGPG